MAECGGAPSFRRAMSALAAGVSVVTTRDGQGRPCGLTVTSVCLVSQEPPLLLVCVGRQADCFDVFETSGAFAVNLLHDGQEALSRRFGQKERTKFAAVAWEPGQLGLPLLPDALAAIECRVIRRQEAGDHLVLFGHAEAWRLESHGRSPLIYFRRAYRRLVPPEQPASDPLTAAWSGPAG